MIDTLSILTHSTLPLAKIWHADGTISDYARPKNFSVKPIAVDSIRNLSALLFTLEKNPHSCLIRGKFIGEDPHLTVRRKDVFADQPLRTLLIEVDKYRPLLSDPIAETTNAVEEYIQTQLPNCFHNCSYHWQLSNSAGNTKNAGILKAHIWFFLETPYSSAQLKAWAKNNSLPLDIATLDPVQIHYTSAPIFEKGVLNPVPVRSGFVSLENSAVALKLDPDSLAAVARQTLPGEAYKGDDPTANWLQDKGIAKGLGASGQVLLDCPFYEGHTDGKIGESDTTYLPARAGYLDGIYHCSHASCARRDSSEFESALGSAAAYFDSLPRVTKSEENISGEKITNAPERFAVIQAGDYADRPPAKWLIKGILPEHSLFLFYGGSGDGKTFCVLDMMFSLCRGIDWNGHKTRRQARVVYVCAEGAGGFNSRLRAYQRHTDVDLKTLPLGVIAGIPNFRHLDDVKQLAARVNAFGATDIIIIDTLAQVTPGADENAGKDMSIALRHCEELKRLTNASTGLVHHAGKDASRGARGWSGIKAPLDAEFSVSKDEGSGKRKLWVEKMKDGRDGFGWEFELQEISYAVDEDGDELSSGVVNYLGPATVKKTVKPSGHPGYKQAVLDAFDELGSTRELTSTIIGVVLKNTPYDNEAKDCRRGLITRAIKELAYTHELRCEGPVLFLNAEE